MARGDVEIVIGAKDQATDILRKTEASMQNFEKELKKVSASTENMQASFDRTVAGFKKIAVAATAAIAVFKGAVAAFGQMNASVEAFSKQEEAARGMTQAQLDFAASLQVATNAGDEMTLMLMKKAEAMGASKDESDEMAASAIALSEVFGINQEEALKKLSQAVNGNANAFAELIPEIRNATTEQEKLDLIQQRIGTGFTMLQEKADTTQGAMQRSAGAFGDLQEKIGALLAPLYRIVHTGLAVFAETLQTKLMPIIESFTPTAETMGAALESVANYFSKAAHVLGVAFQAMANIASGVFRGIISLLGGAGDAATNMEGVFNSVAKGIIFAITAYETAVTSFYEIVEYIFLKVKLVIVGFVEDIKYFFTTEIPAYFAWFVDNAGNMFRDLGMLIVTVFKNLGTKIGESMFALWDFISSGFEGGLGGFGDKLANILSGSLTAGFEATTQALPQIAGRGMTATEQEMTRRANELGANIGDEFNKKYEERIAGLDTKIQADVEVAIDPLVSKAQGEIEAAQKSEEQIAKGLEKAMSGSQLGELAANQSRLLQRGVSERSPMQFIFEEIQHNTAATAGNVLVLQGEISTLRNELAKLKPTTTVNITPTP